MLADIEPEVLEKLSRCKDLPSPPGVAAQIIELTQSTNSNVETLAEVVSMDPVLSAKLIRMSNSSLYMRRVEAVSVQQAVSMFGWSGTLNIALSFSFAGGMQARKNDGLDYELFWKRSLATAVSCRRLGEITGYPLREELFLPGLLQDIGMLAIDKAIPGVYTDLGDRQQDHAFVCQLEKEKISSDHSAVGHWLLNSWRIPEKITRLVGISHDFDVDDHGDIDVDEKLAACITYSGMMADCIYCDEEYKDYMVAAELAEQKFKLDITDFLSLIGKLTEEYQELAILFDVDPGDNGVLQENAENAKKVLQQSMGIVA